LKKTANKILKFFSDDTLYYAASLSFFTIFSLLPILALILVVMSSYEPFISQVDIFMLHVMDLVNPTHSEAVSSGIGGFLKNIDKLGSLGIVYLLFVFTMFFKDYEYVVSKIHHTQKRSFIKLTILYIFMIFLIPITLLVFTFISTFISAYNIQFILNYIFGLFILTLLFKIAINKTVSVKAAFTSAFFTLAVLKITQTLFLYYVLHNTTYNTIYGTLSVLLFMFLWIYISWTIYLYGVKISYLLNKAKINDVEAINEN
jgi:membrane protein